MKPTLIPDAELEAIEKDVEANQFLHWYNRENVFRLIREVRLLRGILMDTMEQPTPQNPPTEDGLYWVIPTNPAWCQDPEILPWAEGRWKDPEWGWLDASKFRAISARLVPPETR